jgi:tetratricopeptide (TPR) repeat protein
VFFDRNPARLAALVFAASLLVYFPALQGTLLWDDIGHITRPDLRTFAGLARIWFEPGATQQYYPLLHSAFWFEYQLWGDATLGYHLVNVLLHATSACLLAALLRRLAIPGSAFAALLFALHPVCVESVAWIAEQKNTLSTALYLSAALAYFRFESSRERGRPRPQSYALATALFLCALLTKTVTATLPAALLVVTWWRRGRLEFRRDVLPLLPWFILGLAGGLFTAHFERKLIGAEGAAFALDLFERSLLAGRALWFYLGKLVWPVDLVFVYPHWTVDAAQIVQWLFPLAALGLLAMAVYFARTKACGRGALTALLLFAGTLFPVLGFFNIYPFLFSYVADHFQYLATLPMFALAGAALARLPARVPRGLAIAAPVVLLFALGARSFAQARTYRDVFALYQATLARNPSAWMAHNNLAVALTSAGRPAEAIPHLEQALQLRPHYPQAENNLGDALVRLGRPAEAIPHFENALRLQPRFAEARNNLGFAFAALDRPADAIASYEQALALDPDYALAHRNLALALATSGRNAEAIPHFQRVAQLDPHDAQAELGWAVALLLSSRFDDALPHFERAVQLDPASPNIHQTYGRALATRGRFDDAIAHYRAALDLDPSDAETHLALAQILRRLGRSEEAQAHFAAAHRLGR